MKVLIVGGTGLISSEITRILASRGHELTLYNRGSTDADLPDGVDALHGDRTDHATFEADLGDLAVDCVVDMWAMTPADVESVVETFAGRIDQYVLCSTVDVYESPPREYPLTEETPLVRSGAGYAPNKAACERRAREAGAAGAFAVTCLRPGYTYGDDSSMLTTFGFGTGTVGRVRDGKPIVVHGDGTALWGGCHRDDVARAFANAVGNEAAYGESYHLTSDQWITWNRFVDHIATVMDAPDPDVVHVPTDLLLEALPEDRTGVLERVLQYSFVYDNAKAARDLDFEYTVPFTEGTARALKARRRRGTIPADDPFEADIVDAWRDAEVTFLEAVST